MKFDFYTFGGRFFWEDVFYYQKWRIQRHYPQKICRLLDGWDIKRFEGDFVSCYDEFLKQVKVSEITKQSGHMVIMLPSFFESKNVFKPLWREVIKKGHNVAALNYPSTMKDADAHAIQINFFLNHLEDISEVSFVTKGASAMILNKIIKSRAKWKNKLKVRSIITINPPQMASPLFTKLMKNKIIQKIFGPMSKNYATFSPNFTSECIKVKKFNKYNIQKIIKKL